MEFPLENLFGFLPSKHKSSFTGKRFHLCHTYKTEIKLLFWIYLHFLKKALQTCSLDPC